jgi:hypothetical protein
MYSESSIPIVYKRETLARGTIAEIFPFFPIVIINAGGIGIVNKGAFQRFYFLHQCGIHSGKHQGLISTFKLNKGRFVYLIWAITNLKLGNRKICK